MVNNYEYEVPLTLTPHGVYSSVARDREIVWYPDNMIDFPFEYRTDAKLKRNKAKGDSTFFVPEKPQPHHVRQSIHIEVENIMIGIRNRSNNIKSVK